MTEWGLSMLMTVFVFDQILLFFVSLTDEMSVNNSRFKPGKKRQGVLTGGSSVNGRIALA